MKQEIKDFFESLHLHKKYVMEAGLIVGGIPEERLFNHDASKFTEAEYPHYARQFHGDKDDPAGFARAWLNHIHLNDHHWNHWLFADGYSATNSGIDSNGALPMPEVCVREMVADWMGASKAYTDSWDMTDWLQVNLDLIDLSASRIKIHAETVEILISVLDGIGYEVCDVATFGRNEDLPRITEQTVECSCGWRGTVYDCEPDVDGDGSLGCAECSAVVKVK